MIEGGAEVRPGRLDAAESEPSRGDRSGARRHGARRGNGLRAQPGAPTFNPDAVLPILIHGDAAFPGQGVVAETLNLHRLSGYTTGGTIHIIANNQIGFTTDTIDSYSTLYASGLARAFKIPIIHVNADDPEACVAAARLAFAYRAKFKRDFLIDLVGYRRYGHNEGDEPAFTQPVMYQKVHGAAHRPREVGEDARIARRDRRPAKPTRCCVAHGRAAGRSSKRWTRSNIYVEADARGGGAGHRGRREDCRSARHASRDQRRAARQRRRAFTCIASSSAAATAGARRLPIRRRRRSTGPRPRISRSPRSSPTARRSG